MKMLTSEVKGLLDKLYNLRGKDSVILARMNQEREEAIETQERTKKEKAVLLDKIDVLTKEEETLAKEGKSLSTVLSSIKKKDFAMVLDRLQLDFDPEDIKSKIDTMLPDTIAQIVGEHQKANDELKAVEDEMNNAITKAEELEIRKDEALSNQAKLNEYFKMALDGNINITRDSITSLLEKFDFNEDEQREAAKQLMFPEDALYEYDDNVKHAKTAEKVKPEKIVKEEPKVEVKKEVVKEPKEEKTIKTEKIEKVEEVKPEEIKKVEKSSKENSQLENIFEQMMGVQVGTTKETKEEDVSIVDELKKLGIPELSEKDIDMITNQFDKELISNNIDALKNNGIDINIVKDNAELLIDKELVEKLDKLLKVGKDAKDISLMPYVLVKYDLKELNNTIDALQTCGLDPKKVPLMAY